MITACLYVCAVFAGESLFIPRHTWHYVISLDWEYAKLLRGTGVVGDLGGDSSEGSTTDSSGNETQCSFSVSFWWGPSIELEH